MKNSCYNKKIKFRILTGICIFITVMLITATIFRIYAVNSIGSSFFAVSNLTETISLFLIIGGAILDIILIILITALRRKIR